MKVTIAILTVLLLILQFRLWIGEGSLANVAQLETAISEQKTLNSIDAERNQTLEAEILLLKSGHESTEEIAREQLGMIKNDETFYLVVDEKPAEKKR
ncbi:FtsB family cell division protein [Sessilibacter sp. MAH2]